MRILVIGAGVLGSLHAARLHEAGHDVALLARGERLAALRRNGVQLAVGDSPEIHRVPVPVVEQPGGGYDLITLFVRAHQSLEVLESLVDVPGDVLFLHSWAAGPEPLGKVIGPERVVLGFGATGGTMAGDVVRYRKPSLTTRLVPMPIGEPGGRDSPRLHRIGQAFRAAGFKTAIEPRMDAWLKTHAAFEVPLGQAVIAAGGPAILADDPAAVHAMVRQMRHNLTSLRTPLVPAAFKALQVLPEGLLVAVLRRFLRGSTAAQSGLNGPAATTAAELALVASQLEAV